jgi:peptidylprolyl isomerase
MGRYSPLRARRLTAYEQAAERFAASRLGAWLFVHAFTHADRRLLPRTRGRVSLTPGAPVGVLETVGARSGRVRRTPLLYVADGDDLVVVASNVGSARHPGWLHNVRARPRVRFLTPGRGWEQRRARIVVAGPDRDRLWALVIDLYAGYAAYARRAGERTIPVVVLQAVGMESAATPGVTVEGADDLKSKPTVSVDTDAQPPGGLVSHDLVQGEGAELGRGDNADVQYVGVSWSTGREFDSSWDRGAQPFSFPVGAGRVIGGWDQGVVGMRAGGRRLLVIPPDLGYGSRGAGGVIGPDETLVFVVDAL